MKLFLWIVGHAFFPGEVPHGQLHNIRLAEFQSFGQMADPLKSQVSQAVTGGKRAARVVEHPSGPALLRHCINQGERAREAQKAAEKAERSMQFSTEWYAVRIERLRDLLKEHGLWDQGAAILANGTVSHLEPPTYAQVLNQMRWRAEAAEKERDRLREALTEVRDQTGLVAWLDAKAAAGNDLGERDYFAEVARAALRS